MTPDQILWNLPIVVTGLSLVLLLFAALLRKEKLLLVAATLVLSTANATPVTIITADLGFGVGSAVFLMGSVLVILLLYYRINPVLLLFPRLGWPGIFLFLTLYYILLISPIVSIDRIDTIRRGLSYLLVYSVGWVAFGAIFSQRPELTRERVYIMLYAAGSWSIVISIATLILIGPSTFGTVTGNMHAVVELGPYRAQRLQTAFLNATGLAMGAATSIFLIVHWAQSWSRSVLKQAFLIVILPPMVIILLWSAGRTAMLAFAGTVVLLLLLSIITRGGQNRFRAVIFLLVFGVVLISLTDILAGLFLRRGASSLQDAFMADRLVLALEGVSYYRSHLVWGTGTGVLLSSFSFSLGDIVVESFFFRLLIELGVVGGSIYLFTWLVLTYYVIRVDLHYMRRGYPAAWLPSSGIIFIWLTSPASFGFSLFNGGLALQLAIAAAAYVEWKRLALAKQQGKIEHERETRKANRYARSSSQRYYRSL
jgi:hypothetical protein